MAISVDVITNEACDHCGQKVDEPLIRLKWRDPNYGKVQLWIHPTCLRKLQGKAERQIERGL